MERVEIIPNDENDSKDILELLSHPKIIKHGLKKKTPDGSVEEEQEIKLLHEELLQIITPNRIHKVSGRSTAEWDEEKELAFLSRVQGKTFLYGESSNNNTYLNKYETIYLMEMNRLALYRSTVIVSIEQAYHMLLRNHRDCDKYLVYSTFEKAGYHVKISKNQSFTDKKLTLANKVKRFYTDEDLVWKILSKSLNMNLQISDEVQNSTRFHELKSSMQKICERIKDPKSDFITLEQSNEAEYNFFHFTRKVGIKRKQSSESGSKIKEKRSKVEEKYESKSYIDIFRKEPEYIKFEEIFKNIDIIQLQSEPHDNNYRKLKIDFDLYILKKNFKKTNPGPPDFKVLVFGPEENLPNRTELISVYNLQNHKTPLLVASVGMSNNVQIFIYYFT